MNQSVRLKISWVQLVARLLWAVPLLLLFLTVNQAKVAFDLKHTLENGEKTTADVIDMRINDRVDIPFGYVSLKVRLAGGLEIVQEKMALPYTLLPQIRHRDVLDVHVLPGADQQIVISEIAATQWKMAGIQSLMCLVALCLVSTGVYFWSRLLNKKGDPAQTLQPQNSSI